MTPLLSLTRARIFVERILNTFARVAGLVFLQFGTMNQIGTEVREV